MSVYHETAVFSAFIRCDVLTEECLKKIRYVVEKKIIMNIFFDITSKLVNIPSESNT